MPANDPAGSFQELKYAKVATVDAAAEYVPYELVGYPVYRGTDPAVEGNSSDQFFDSAYTPILQSMISRVVDDESPVLARRIARARGWVRTGARIQDRVDHVARAHFGSHDEEQLGTFFWPTHLSPEASPSFRRPGDDDSMRSLTEFAYRGWHLW